MTDVAELQNRVLSELGEFWRENFAALANTVGDGSGVASDLSAVRAAFEGLVEAGLAIVGVDADYPTQLEPLSKRESLGVLAVMEEHLQLQAETGRWVGTREPRPELMITDAGREEANRILAELGERWWLRSN
ncbi:MAG: hypothetical protein M5U16_10340 [Hyphomicrobium sp.]|nr:hypothetical protein [Hyphomicrobium sp.]